MTRISDDVVVQRVDDLIVVVQDSTGQEIALPVDVARRMVAAVEYLLGGDGVTVARVVGRLSPQPPLVGDTVRYRDPDGEGDITGQVMESGPAHVLIRVLHQSPGTRPVVIGAVHWDQLEVLR